MIQQINHGISTGALFLIVGMLYERRHTREISEFGGHLERHAGVRHDYMIMFMSSLGLPLLNGFIGEFTILQGAFMVSKLWAAAGGVAASCWAQRTCCGCTSALCSGR